MFSIIHREPRPRMTMFSVALRAEFYLPVLVNWHAHYATFLPKLCSYFEELLGVADEVCSWDCDQALCLLMRFAGCVLTQVSDGTGFF